MNRVLLIGNGAREHAIATALARAGAKIHAHMQRNNPGIAHLAEHVTIGNITNPQAIPEPSDFDFVIIGPEAPLAGGVADYVAAKGTPVVGPLRALARIETSKAYARETLSRVAPDANPRYSIIRSPDEMREFESEVGLEQIVVKPDGLTGGKGVRLFGEHLRNRDEVAAYIKALLNSHESVVLEERLVGTEFTLQALVDGSRLALLPLVRDYKRAYDDDKGPNTGSMGSYSRETHDLTYLSPDDIARAKRVMQATIDGLKRENGADYKGVLYGQFIKTQDGIRVIEFNARFGDPEAMNVLSIMSSSFVDVCGMLIDGNLKRIEFEPTATVCVYVVPEGYPGPETVKDSPITIDADIQSELYYASVYESNGEIYTTGSRAIAVLGKGDTVPEARRNAYADVTKIHGRLRYRTDIAANINGGS